jgi:hypothetical protein
MENCFIEVGSESRSKYGQRVSGDTFLSKMIKEEGRIVAVLSDGLGSGIKASVLSTLTATMALKYMENHMDIEKAASVIMKTLPVCKERRISYATFTILDITAEGIVNIVEYDNPSYIYLCETGCLQVEKKEVRIGYRRQHPAKLYISKIQIKKGDRIIFHSDGLNQSGMGKIATPLGWGTVGVQNHVMNLVQNEKTISARNMAKRLVDFATGNDGQRNGDDTTCGVVYFRNPRKVLVVTGPPVEQNNDSDLAISLRSFEGKKVICGGTTAKIIARELNRKALVDLRNLHPQIPPVSLMDGVDLVTEGIITLTMALEYLEAQHLPVVTNPNAATQLANILLDNDEITFVVGTKLNDANQVINSKPMEIRLTIVRKLSTILELRYLKKVIIKYI